MRGYVSLLIIQRLMYAIEKEETSRPEPHQSSYWPKVELPPIDEAEAEEEDDEDENDAPPEGTGLIAGVTDQTEDFENLERKITSSDLNSYTGFLPCHYFDWMGGTSTGG